MPSEWKERANQRRDTRHMKEGPETTGPNKKKKPSPQKRKKQTPIWEVAASFEGRLALNDDHFTYVSAETRTAAVEKAWATWTYQAPTRFRATQLHQKERWRFGNVLDTGLWLTWQEFTKRWMQQEKGTDNE